MHINSGTTKMKVWNLMSWSKVFTIVHCHGIYDTDENKQLNNKKSVQCFVEIILTRKMTVLTLF